MPALQKVRKKTYKQTVLRWANAKRVSAGNHPTLTEGDFVDRWIPHLAGQPVGVIGRENKFATKAEAITEAKAVRDICRKEAEEKGWQCR
jgi:hypothetical protein